MIPMPYSHTFTFGKLEVHGTFAVIICNSGENIGHDKVNQIHAVLEAHCRQPIGLIAYRVNSYSVDPFAIAQLFSSELLKAGAIVTTKPVAKEVAELEKHYINNGLPEGQTLSGRRDGFDGVKTSQKTDSRVQDVPIEVFPNLPAAIAWVDSLD